MPGSGDGLGRNPRARKFALMSSRLRKLTGVTSTRTLRTAFAVLALTFGVEVANAPAAFADPPYQDCNDARADGRSSIPYTDPAYQPELDLDGDGLACEPSKAHRSRR